MTSPARLIPLICIALAAPALATQGRDLSSASVADGEAHGAAVAAATPSVALEPNLPLTHLRVAAAAPVPAAGVASRSSTRPVTILRANGPSLRRQIAAAGLVATAAVATCAILEWGGRSAGPHRTGAARTAVFDGLDAREAMGGPAAKRATAAPAGTSRLDAKSWGASDYLSAAIIGAGIALPFLSGDDDDGEGDARVSVRPMTRRPGLLWLIGVGR